MKIDKTKIIKISVFSAIALVLGVLLIVSISLVYKNLGTNDANLIMNGPLIFLIILLILLPVLLIMLILNIVLGKKDVNQNISSDKKTDENNRYVDAKLKKKTSTSRFYQLTQQDKKMENYKAPEYNTKIELDE
ncbi:MAG: hypothetical protein MR357_08255, partial [Anaeroplasma sp.]|nr:hypothetical protein [Anaeroplasma sp.]